MAGVNDINIENQLALETLKRLGSGVVGGLRNLNQPPQTIAPNIYGTQPQPASVPAAPGVAAKFPRGGGLPATMTREDVAIKPDLPAQQTTNRFGLRQSGNTFSLGAPGQDDYGRMTVSPGTPMSAEESRFRAPVTPLGGGLRATGRMIQAVSPDYSFLRPSSPTTAPIDFASMNRPERRFALRNAQLSQEQQQLDNTYDLGLRTVAASQQNALLRDQETPAQAGLRQAQAQEAGARTSLLTEQAKIAGNEKFISTFEETPYTDPVTGLTAMRKSPILVNPNNPNEVIRPGQTATKAPTEADFTAAIDANPERRKAYNGLSPEKQAKLRDKFLQSGAM